MLDFRNIEYLRTGNQRQREAYAVLSDSVVLISLSEYTPLLVGTIPIGIDIETSDLDIICCWKDKERFIQTLVNSFSEYDDFEIRETDVYGADSVVASFRISGFEFEIFGQNIPVKHQNAYKHMLIEYNLLQEKGELFRQQVVALKKEGYKTEPAFALLLGLKGDPYSELLKLEK